MQDFIFIAVDMRTGRMVGEMSMKDFSEWVEDTSQYQQWAEKYSDKSYAKRRMLHDLSICEDYSRINNKEVEWNSFRFIPTS